jgi:Biopolymer transport protein ExbD/TolR
MFRSLINTARLAAFTMIDLLPVDGKTGLSSQEPSPWSPSRIARERLTKRRSGFLCRMETSAFVSIIWAFIAPFIAIQASPHDWRYFHHPDLIPVKHATPMPNALREDALLVTVKRDGEFFLGNLEVKPDNLAGLIKTRLQEGPERKVYLRVDGRTRYLDVSIVPEEIKRTGLQDVCFLTQ